MSQRTLTTQLLACALTLLSYGSAARAEKPSERGSGETENSDSSDDSAYEDVKHRAVIEWNAGHWAEARALFLIAHRLRPSARTWRTLGMTAFELRQYPDAVRELTAALGDARSPLDEALQQETRALLERANAFVGRYRLRLEPAALRLQVDGTLSQLEPDGSLLLSVGPHQLEAQASGFVTMRRPVIVTGTDGETLRFQLQPLPDPDVQTSGATGYPFTWALGASALAAGSTSFVLYRRAAHHDERAEALCRDGCERDSPVTRKRDNLIKWSNATLGTCAILAAGALVLYFVERRSKARRSARGGAFTGHFGLSHGQRPELTIRF